MGFLIVSSRLLIYLFFMNVKGKNFSFASVKLRITADFLTSLNASKTEY